MNISLYILRLVRLVVDITQTEFRQVILIADCKQGNEIGEKAGIEGQCKDIYSKMNIEVTNVFDLTLHSLVAGCLHQKTHGTSHITPAAGTGTACNILQILFYPDLSIENEVRRAHYIYIYIYLIYKDEMVFCSFQFVCLFVPYTNPHF